VGIVLMVNFAIFSCNGPMTVLFSIRSGGQFGFIDATGRIVIEPKLQNDRFYSHYEGAVDFRDWVPVKQDKSWGYIDRRGKFVIPPKFSMVDPFSEDLAAFGEPLGRSYGITNFKWGYIDRRGDIRIAARFGWAMEFCQGLAAVALPDLDGEFSRWFAEWALIDPRGNIVQRGFQSLFPLKENRWLARKEGLWGYLDSVGSELIPYQFDHAYKFVDGRARVVQGGRHAIIDCDGKILFCCQATDPLPQYSWARQDYIFMLNEGLTLDFCNDKWGFLDSQGKVAVDYAYDDAAAFYQGLAAVKVGKKWGYVDKRGQMVIAPTFEEASEFHEGRAHAKVKVKQGGKMVTRYGFIDTTGAMVIEPQFSKTDERPVCFQFGLAAVVKEKRRQYINVNGDVVWEE